jgi:outer membrane lipoprotein-sorting protein
MNRRSALAILLSATFFASGFVSVQAQGVQQVIQGMQARWNAIRDASAVIEIQTWNKKEGDKVNVFYGQLYYRVPMLIRLEYSPAPSSATGTQNLYPLGENKYMYLHDGHHLSRYSETQKAWLDQYGSDPVIAMVNQITDINNFDVQRFLSIYQVADVRTDNSLGIPAYILRAEPKSRGGQHPRQLLWINQRTYLPVETILARETNEVSVFFHKIKQNTGLPAEIFSTGWKK